MSAPKQADDAAELANQIRLLESKSKHAYSVVSLQTKSASSTCWLTPARAGWLFTVKRFEFVLTETKHIYHCSDLRCKLEP